MKQPHEHIAARYCQRAGSPYQAFKSRRRVSVFEWVSTSVAVLTVLVLLFALPWEGGW